MRGSRAILALAALALILGATALWAQDPYAMPLDRAIDPGRTSIKYDNHIYTFIAESKLNVHLEKVDAKRVKLVIRPLTQVTPYEEISLQWGSFSAIALSLDATGGGTFILNSETGYAEK